MSRSRWRWAVAFFFVLARGANAEAYEEDTHRELTRAALARSVLETPVFLATLGFDPEDDIPYRNLIENGGICEDAIPRFVNHFYDPISEAGLTIGGVPIGMASPRWALDDPPVPLAPDAVRNAYTLRLFYAELATSVSATTEVARNVAFSRASDILGHVLHHVQDMAQPEHTRNDVHFPVPWSASPYEKYVEDCIENLRPLLSIPYPQLGTLAAQRTLQFWTGDGRGLADYSNRNFISDDTNFRGFVDPQTGDIIASPTLAYPLPSEPFVVQRISLEALAAEPRSCGNFTGFTSTAEQGFVGTEVVDEVEDTTILNPRTSAFGIFHADLRDVSPECLAANPGGCTSASFGENVFTLERKASLLLPRAVGYGAAMLDHALRGIVFDGAPAMRLTVEDLETGMGTITIENTTLHDWIAGTISIWFDDRETGLRRQLGGSIGPVTVVAGGSITLGSTDLPLDELAMQGPISGQIAVLFEGAMGELGGESDPYGLAARVCECPVEEGAVDSDARDCLGLCPCTWRELTTGPPGSPGTPGDGTAVPPASVDLPAHVSTYTFTSCHSVAHPLAPSPPEPTPFTLTLFPAGDLRPAWVDAGSAAPETISCLTPGKCGGTHLQGGERALEVGTTTFAGRTGYYGSFEDFNNDHDDGRCNGEHYRDVWGGAVVCLTADPPGCDVAPNACTCVASDLDAIMFCHGADAFPSDP